VQTIASEVESLAVFQRTANYTIPMKNYDYPASEPLQVDRAELRQKTHDTFGGFDFDMEQRLWADVDIEERRASYFCCKYKL
jgi:acetone monooxygenase